MELGENRWVTDGGLETDLIFNRGVPLDEFASFPLLDDPAGRRTLQEYYAGYAAIAVAADAGLLVETPTWRANPDWGRTIGYDRDALDRINRAAPEVVRGELEALGLPTFLVSGSVGPRGDGYLASDGVDPDEAAEYHLPQVRALAAGGADLVHAMTLTGAEEAIGVVRAARTSAVAVAVSFTVETDGRLPDGSTLGEAIDAVESAAAADFYGINCAHPLHVLHGLDGGAWQESVTFFRPNASRRSHEELDAMEELDIGDLGLLVRSTDELSAFLPGLAVLGGCCGTDARHVAALWGVPAP